MDPSIQVTGRHKAVETHRPAAPSMPRAAAADAVPVDVLDPQARSGGTILDPRKATTARAPELRAAPPPEPNTPASVGAAPESTAATTRPDPHQPLVCLDETSAPAAPPTPAGPAPLLLLAQLADARADAVFTKDSAAITRGVPLHGVALDSIPDPDWYKHVPDVDVAAPPMPQIDGKSPSAGVIMLEPDGRMWLVEPTGHYNGIEHTFPKGGLEDGLTEQQTALKEVMEESGLKARITGFLGDYTTRTTVTRMFIGQRTGGNAGDFHWETQAAKLVTPESAAHLLNRPANQDMLDDLMHVLRGDPPQHSLQARPGNS